MTSAPLPSNRATAFLFAAVAAVLGLWPLATGGAMRGWAVAAAVAFLLAGWLVPGRLTPMTRAWMAFGALLHRLVSPLVLGAVYFLLITPVAWGMRAFGRDALARCFDRQRPSYWVERTPPGPAPDSLRHPY